MKFDFVKVFILNCVNLETYCPQQIYWHNQPPSTYSYSWAIKMPVCLRNSIQTGNKIPN